MVWFWFLGWGWVGEPKGEAPKGAGAGVGAGVEEPKGVLELEVAFVEEPKPGEPKGGFELELAFVEEPKPGEPKAGAGAAEPKAGAEEPKAGAEEPKAGVEEPKAGAGAGARVGAGAREVEAALPNAPNPVLVVWLGAAPKPVDDDAADDDCANGFPPPEPPPNRIGFVVEFPLLATEPNVVLPMDGAPKVGCKAAGLPNGVAVGLSLPLFCCPPKPVPPPNIAPFCVSSCSTVSTT